MNHVLFHRIVLFALTAVGLFALVYLCLFAWVCYAESHLETPPETDVIIVLGAQVKPDGTPSVQLGWRLDAAYDAYRQKAVPMVVCGAQGKDEPMTEAEAMKLYGQAAMMQMVTEKLPEIARAVSEPLSKTEKIILFGEGGATSMARDTAGTMLQTFEAVKDAVGLDIPKAIRDVTTGGLIGKAAQENEKEEKESVKDEPVQAEPEMEETAPEPNGVPAEDNTEKPEED